MTEKTQRPEQARLALGIAPGAGNREYKPFVPGPNPELPEFIKQHTTPYDPKMDKYDVKAFDQDLIADARTAPKAINDLFTYWGKKHWATVREYIRHYLPKKYYQEGTGLVLDCFSGSGMTGVAAMMENRPCVLVDASPAAAFISHCYTHPVDPNEHEAAYERMMKEEYPPDLKKRLKDITGEEIRNLQQELNWLYATKCDRCGGDASIDYVVYSERFQCPRCGEVVALFDCPEVKVPYLVGSKAKQKAELKKRRVCPHCLKRNGEPHRDFAVSTRTKKFGAVPVLIRYKCKGSCKPHESDRRHDEHRSSMKARFFDEDLRKVNVIEKAKQPHWHPACTMVAGWETRHKRRLDLQGVDLVTDMYTKRNLWGLGAMHSALRRNKIALGPLHLCFMAILLGASRMNMYAASNWSMRNRYLRATYYLPQLSTAMNVGDEFRHEWKIIKGALNSLNEALQNGHVSAQITNESVLEFSSREEYLDYVFTDPPYVHKIQYGELNYIWEAWLDFGVTWLGKEIVVNPYRGKMLQHWEDDLRKSLTNIFYGLKPGRWLSLCYHDTEPGTWMRIQNVLKDVGFRIDTVTVLDPRQKTLKMLMGEKVVRCDLVLNCIKPYVTKSEAHCGESEATLISDRVRDILLDTLSTTGGLTRDKLWDIVLRRLLVRGRMAEHRFDDIMSKVATRSDSGRWFLKEEFENLSESDLRNEEDAGAALERFARLRCFGVPVALASQLALGGSITGGMDEDEVEKHIKREVLTGAEGQAFKLSGRMRGCEFYDCLFFYLTRYLKGRSTGRIPRRNLAEFLEEYMVRFRDGDKWLYRPPTGAEAASLKKSRQSGLGRRVRQFVAYLNGEGDFPKERIPDAKTLVAWLKHCANFGLAEAGVALFEKGGLMGQVSQLGDDERYDAEDYYAQCRRNAGKKHEDVGEDGEGEQENGEE